RLQRRPSVVVQYWVPTSEVEMVACLLFANDPHREPTPTFGLAPRPSNDRITLRGVRRYSLDPIPRRIAVGSVSRVKAIEPLHSRTSVAEGPRSAAGSRGFDSRPRLTKSRVAGLLPRLVRRRMDALPGTPGSRATRQLAAMLPSARTQ